MSLPLIAIFSQPWCRKAVCFEHKRKLLLNDKMDIQSNPEQRQWTLYNKENEHSWWIFLISEFEIYLQWNTSYQSTRQKVKGVTHVLTGTFSQKYRAEQLPSFLAFQHCLWHPASLHHHHPAKSCYRQQSLKCHICRKLFINPKLILYRLFFLRQESMPYNFCCPYSFIHSLSKILLLSLAST